MSRFRDGLVAGAWGGLLGGIPSTVHAVATGRDVLDTVRAAGSIALPHGSGAQQMAAAPFVHGALSLGWGVVLSYAVPRKRAWLWGAAAGLAISWLDLTVIGKRFPQVRDLPPIPQWLDHVAYGAIVGAVIAQRSRQLDQTPA